jgi:uncharacterized membrane protein YcaP (DUF421 family)
LAGKRELAQLNTFDLVVLLTLSNTVQNAIIGNDNSVLGGIIGAATLLALNYLVVRFLSTHAKLDEIVEGTPEVIIEHGHIKQEVLRKELITLPELEVAAHKQGFASLHEIEKAVLEPGGSLSFIARRPEPDTTRHQEVMGRLDQMTAELRELRLRLS